MLFNKIDFVQFGKDALHSVPPLEMTAKAVHKIGEAAEWSVDKMVKLYNFDQKLKQQNKRETIE